MSPYIVVQGVEREQIPNGDYIEIIKVISGTREDKKKPTFKLDFDGAFIDGIFL